MGLIKASQRRERLRGPDKQIFCLQRSGPAGSQRCAAGAAGGEGEGFQSGRAPGAEPCPLRAWAPGSPRCATRSPQRTGNRRRGSSSPGRGTVGTGDGARGWLSSHRRAAAELPAAWQRWLLGTSDPERVPRSVRRAHGSSPLSPSTVWGPRSLPWTRATPSAAAARAASPTSSRDGRSPRPRVPVPVPVPAAASGSDGRR